MSIQAAKVPAEAAPADAAQVAFTIRLVSRLRALDRAWLAVALVFIALLLVSPGQAMRSAVFAAQSLWGVLPFLLLSVAIAAYATTLAMLTASFTTRRAYASVFLVGLFVITAPFTIGLASEMEGPAGQWISMFNLTNIPVHVNDVIFGAVSELTEDAPAGKLPKPLLVGWYFAWTVVPGLLLWWRYRRLTP